MDRRICKKRHFLFWFPHRTYVLDICYNRLSEAILTNIQNICCLKILCNVFAYFLINRHLLSESFFDIQIVILTNFVVVLSVGINSVDFNNTWHHFQLLEVFDTQNYLMVIAKQTIVTIPGICYGSSA